MPEMEHYTYEACWIPEGKVMKSKWEENCYTIMQEGHLRYILDQLYRKKTPISVMELGAGFGRITEIILKDRNVQYYRAIDISQDQLNHIKERFPQVDCSRNDITELKDGISMFDLVVSAEFLMHVKPEHIQGVFSYMDSLVKPGGHIINMDYYPVEQVKRNLSVHNFLHDYHSLYSGIGRQSFFHRIYDYQGIFWT